MRVNLILLLVIVNSCNNRIENRKFKSDYISEETKQKNNSNLNKDSILFENKIKHLFSNNSLKDEFKLSVKGKTIVDGIVDFTIINSHGEKILHEKFPSIYLLNYDFQGNFESNVDKEKFIKNRILNFFNEDNFSLPAIKEDEEFMEDYVEQDIWNDIKSDNSSVGFYYLIGEEDGRKIAYSKKIKKVVMYYNCC